MIPNDRAFVGIDVGGVTKGFHVVALHGRNVERKTSPHAAEIARWCIERSDVVAVDAPCGWSQVGSSRLSERELKLSGRKINCFSTPTRTMAQAHRKHFYDWVFNGEELYCELRAYYQLFNGERPEGPTCFETFPHAIVCALIGKVVPAKPKNSTRREVLRNLGCDDRPLKSIDFVDAALCAVTAEQFSSGRTMNFGTREEGIIVVPNPDRGLT